MQPPQSTHFNAFGTPIVAPQALTRMERIDLLRRAAGTLQAGRVDRYTAAWLGGVLAEWLSTGEPLEALLGVRPEPGSRMTVAELTRQRRCDTALLQLSAAAGGDRQAARVLAGEIACPSSGLGPLEILRELNAPTSPAAFGRARERADSRPT